MKSFDTFDFAAQFLIEAEKPIVVDAVFAALLGEIGGGIRLRSELRIEPAAFNKRNSKTRQVKPQSEVISRDVPAIIDRKTWCNRLRFHGFGAIWASS